MMLAVSEITREVDHAFWLIGGTCVLLFIGVTAAMIFLAYKYRRSERKTTQQIEGHALLETTWIVIPTLIVTWMFFVGYQGFGLMRQIPEDSMVVEVVGQKWFWTFRYPDLDIEDKILVVPVNTNIRCNMRAPVEDVIHSFYLPDFRVKEDVLPGKDTHLWFRSERVGTFKIFCAEFCGTGHSDMLTELRVVTQAEFDQWVRTTRSRKYEPLVYEAVIDPNHEKFGPTEQNINSEELYAVYCATCHGNDGRGEGVENARNFTVLNDWKNGEKVTDIYRTLDKGVDGTQMRAFPNLAPWQRVALAHYVRAFIGGSPSDTSRQDFDQLVKEFALDKIRPPDEAMPIEEAMQRLAQEAQASQPSTQLSPGQ